MPIILPDQGYSSLQVGGEKMHVNLQVIGIEDMIIV